MPIPQEVDDLERLIVSLTQEIARSKASLTTLQNKINLAQANLERCRSFDPMCRESLQKLKKADVVSLEDYKKILKLYEDNYDMILKYQSDMLNRQRERLFIENGIPVMESALKAARVRLSQWGQVVPIRPSNE